MDRSRVFIEGFRYDTTVREIKHFFRNCGPIRSIILKKRYAFIDFKSSRDAKKAVYDLDQEKLLGERVTVKIANRQPYSSNTYKLRVQNLSTRVDSYRLKKFMSQVGQVVRAEAHKRYYNEGSVEFAGYEDIRRGLRLDGTILEGRKIRIIEDNRRGRSVSDGEAELQAASSTGRFRGLSPQSESSTRSRSYDSGL